MIWNDSYQHYYPTRPDTLVLQSHHLASYVLYRAIHWRALYVSTLQSGYTMAHGFVQQNGPYKWMTIYPINFIIWEPIWEKRVFTIYPIWSYSISGDRVSGLQCSALWCPPHPQIKACNLELKCSRLIFCIPLLRCVPGLIGPLLLEENIQLNQNALACRITINKLVHARRWICFYVLFAQFVHPRVVSVRWMHALYMNRLLTD